MVSSKKYIIYGRKKFQEKQIKHGEKSIITIF